MRSRLMFPCLLILVLAAFSAGSHLGASEEEATTAPAEPEALTTEAEPPETAPTDAPPVKVEPPADPFLDQSEVDITPVHDVFCPCQVGVNCCGDSEVDIGCGKRRECVCNSQNQCILLHVHRPK